MDFCINTHITKVSNHGVFFQSVVNEQYENIKPQYPIGSYNNDNASDRNSVASNMRSVARSHMDREESDDSEIVALKKMSTLII